MPSSSRLYTRQLAERIRHDLGVYPAVAIMGARQVGKTTLARLIGQELGMAYCSLDEQGIREQALEDPTGLIESVADTGAVFDEVQRAPDLLLSLKTVVDREQRNGRFILTGSNQPRVGQHVADSLVGRVAYRTLRPLTLGEQREDARSGRWNSFFDLTGDDLVGALIEAERLSGQLDWRSVTATGGMPRALSAPTEDRLQVLDDYLQTFARRDIRDILAVESVERLEQFLRLVAARTGAELNYASIAGDLGQSPRTIHRWIEVLERSYLVTLIQPYSRNASSRVIKRPKLFMVDPALAVAGSGDPTPSGFHFETLVANDLLVWRDDGPGRGLFYWRLASGQEVDFVLSRGSRLVPVEVKCSADIGRNDARHLRSFLAEHQESDLGVLLSSNPDIHWIADNVIAAPWWAVL